MTEQSDAVEAALWSAMRALEEKAALARRLAAQARQQQRTLSEAHFMEQANETSEQAKILRHLIYHDGDKLQSGNKQELASELRDND